MSIEDQVSTLREASKKAHLFEYADKDKFELDYLARTINLQIQASQNPYEAAKMLGQLDACVALLEKLNELEESRKILEDAIENDWEDILAAKRAAAVLNLPTATSYLGQLVVAVLEEFPYATKEEIRQWADDLTALEDEEYSNLLQSLVKEGVLGIYDEDDEDEYYVEQVCTETLLPEDPVAWAIKKGNLKYKKEEIAFLEEMADRMEPLTVFDWSDLHGSAMMHYPTIHNTRSDINRMVNSGVLSSTRIKCTKQNFHLYYFRLLGEKEEA